MKKSNALALSGLTFGIVFLAFIYRYLSLSDTDTLSVEKSKPDQETTPNFVVENLDNSNFVRDKDNELTFDIDGEVFTFHLKKLDVEAFTLPDKSADYLYSRLSERALNGEIVPARLLSDFISACGETHFDKEQHDKTMERFISDNIIPTADPRFADSAIEFPEEQKELIVKQFEAQFERCQGLTIEQRGEARKWAKIASDGGDFLALQQLTKHPETSSSERIELLEKQWLDHGYIHAPTAIAIGLAGFSNGFQSFQDLEADPKKAYAYFLISKNLNVALERYKGSDSITINEKVTGHDIFESLLTAKLSAHEHLEAEELAKQIMRDSPECCAIDPRAGVKLSIRE